MSNTNSLYWFVPHLVTLTRNTRPQQQQQHCMIVWHFSHDDAWRVEKDRRWRYLLSTVVLVVLLLFFLRRRSPFCFIIILFFVCACLNNGQRLIKHNAKVELITMLMTSTLFVIWPLPSATIVRLVRYVLVCLCLCVCYEKLDYNLYNVNAHRYKSLATNLSTDLIGLFVSIYFLWLHFDNPTRKISSNQQQNGVFFES